MNNAGGQYPDFPAVQTHGGQFISYDIFGSLFEVTSKYRPPIVPIGRGAYGIVWYVRWSVDLLNFWRDRSFDILFVNWDWWSSVLDSETNELVAMKKIANAFDNHMDAKRTLREIKLLRHLDHENVCYFFFKKISAEIRWIIILIRLFLLQIIAIRDVVPPPLRRQFSDVYIATELMDTDLHQIIRSNQGLSEEHCQVIKLLFFFCFFFLKINNLFQETWDWHESSWNSTSCTSFFEGSSTSTRLKLSTGI